MKKAFVLLLALAVFLSACTGSFRLASKVYQFNREIEDKWMEELVFLGFCIVPVYEVTLGLDMLIFNAIEFWGGENPISASRVPGSQEAVKAGDQAALMTYLPDGRIKIEMKDAGFILERTDSGVIARSLDGKTLYRASKEADGTVSIYNESGELLRSFDAKDWVPPGR